MKFDIRTDAPSVSVLVLTYNHAPVIRQCLDSILMQETSFPYEICIGEDESADGTREICLEYAQRFPEKIVLVLRSQSEPARKAFAAQGNYNYLETMKVCRGKYVADCDGDDAWLDPLKLQKQFDVMEADPSLCLVHSDYAVCDGLQEKLITPHLQRDGNRVHAVPGDQSQFMFDVLTSNYKIMTCTVFSLTSAVRSVMEKSPELFQEYANGDIPLWCELTRYGSFAYIDEPLAIYRRIDESATHSKNPEKQLSYYDRNEDLKLYLARKHNLPTKSIMRQKIRICNRLALVSGNDSEITGLYKKDREAFPFIERVYYRFGKIDVACFLMRKIYSCKYNRRLGST